VLATSPAARLWWRRLPGGAAHPEVTSPAV